MNLKDSPRRLWALVGVVGSLLIVAAAYFLLISGQNATRSDLDSQADAARQVAAVSKTKLLALKKDNVNLAQYKSKLAALEAALPKTPQTAQFVSEMQGIAARSNVKITAINVSAPPTGDAAKQVAVDGAVPMPITIATEGQTSNLEQFLGLLQTSSPRAVLVGTVAETVPDVVTSKSLPTLNIGMKAFVGHS